MLLLKNVSAKITMHRSKLLIMICIKHERANDLSKLADAKEFELRRTNEASESATSELARAKDDHSRLMAEA